MTHEDRIKLLIVRLRLIGTPDANQRVDHMTAFSAGEYGPMPDWLLAAWERDLSDGLYE